MLPDEQLTLRLPFHVQVEGVAVLDRIRVWLLEHRAQVAAVVSPLRIVGGLQLGAPPLAVHSPEEGAAVAERQTMVIAGGTRGTSPAVAFIVDEPA
ncbi:hypothetical protein [Pseudonocardia nigra]|uniref:hypothetical protein n=1 Tax=Pseudonocardia nigra TaxID=1921578 RepID=UPI001FE358A7|nr:hypothetical protein [Pseudonocardia nigra]